MVIAVPTMNGERERETKVSKRAELELEREHGYWGSGSSEGRASERAPRCQGQKRFSEPLWDRRVWISADLQVEADVPRLETARDAERAFRRRKDNEHVRMKIRLKIEADLASF